MGTFKEVPLNPTRSKRTAMKLTWLLVAVFVILQSLQVTEGDPSPAPQGGVGPGVYGGQYCSHWDWKCKRRNLMRCRVYCNRRAPGRVLGCMKYLKCLRYRG